MKELLHIKINSISHSKSILITRNEFNQEFRATVEFATNKISLACTHNITKGDVHRLRELLLDIDEICGSVY